MGNSIQLQRVNLVKKSKCWCCSNVSWLDLIIFLSAEVLQDPTITSKLADTKASGEVKVLDDFYQMLQNDPNRAFYGWVRSSLNPYPVIIFCPEHVVCFLCLLHNYIKVHFRLDLFMETNKYEPWLNYLQGNNFIWVHIVCNTRRREEEMTKVVTDWLRAILEAPSKSCSRHFHILFPL